MSTKRAVSAAALAATISMSALTFGTGFAPAAPGGPTPPPCPNCNGGPGPGGPAPAADRATSRRARRATSRKTHKPTPPQNPQSQQPNAPQNPQTHEPQGPQTSAPQGPQTSAPQGPPSHEPPNGGAPTTAPANAPSNAPSHEPNTRELQAPSTQPPHPAYTPHGTYARGSVDVGGPTDARAGFSVEGHGAPPPPRERGWGWNDGPPPGAPPRNWEGPPPPGGWNGPPPPGGWNRRWDGPPRDVVVAQADFGPFSYNELHGDSDLQLDVRRLGLLVLRSLGSPVLIQLAGHASAICVEAGHNAVATPKAKMSAPVGDSCSSRRLDLLNLLAVQRRPHEPNTQIRNRQPQRQLDQCTDADLAIQHPLQ